jgi:hypothetical protein
VVHLHLQTKQNEDVISTVAIELQKDHHTDNSSKGSNAVKTNPRRLEK